MSWMGSEGLAGGGNARVVWASRRDWPELRCSRSPPRPPFHNPQRRRGYRGDGFFTRVSLYDVHVVVTLALPVLQSLTRVALGLKWKNPVSNDDLEEKALTPKGNRRPASQDPVSTNAGSALDSLWLNSMNAELRKPRSS